MTNGRGPSVGAGVCESRSLRDVMTLAGARRIETGHVRMVVEPASFVKVAAQRRHRGSCSLPLVGGLTSQQVAVEPAAADRDRVTADLDPLRVVVIAADAGQELAWAADF